MALQEQERELTTTAQERDFLKSQVARMEEQMAKAREEVVQKYKANFKDTDKYLDLMMDAVAKYKVALKKADPNFDNDYYESLILGEPLTPVPEDPVGFDQLDPIGTPGVAAEQGTKALTEPAQDAIAQPQASTLTDQLTP